MSIASSFQSTLPNIAIDQNYFVRSYATDSRGNTTYGNNQSFSIESLVDTRPDYIRSAGGAMARFFFL